MRHSKWVVSIVLLLSSLTASGDVCTNLFQDACVERPKRLPDGTEIPLPPSVSDRALRAELTPDLRRTLSQHRSTLFPKLLATFPGRPQCQVRNSPQCEAEMFRLALEQSWQWLHGSQRIPNERYGPARAVIALRSDPDFTRFLNRSNQEVFEALGGREQMTHLRTRLVPRVKELMTLLIERHVTDPAERRRFISRVERLTLATPNCFEELGSAFVVNAYYDPGPNTVAICPALGREHNTVFAYLFPLVHEMGHSIDLCNWTATQPGNMGLNVPAMLDRRYPLGGVLTCLRSENSVGAERHTMTGWLPDSARNVTRQCMNRDEAGETLADWIATQVTAEYVERFGANLTAEQRRNGYRNAARVLCNPPADETHPAGPRRINRVLAAHPDVRRQMGCSSRSSDVTNCGGTLRRSTSPSAAGRSSN